MDISERIRTEEALRESEEKFRGIAEGSFDIIFILNNEGEITYVSPVVERVLGYNPDILLGKNFIEVIPESEYPRIDTVNEELSKGVGFEGFELKIRRKDGTLRYFEANIAPIYKNNESIGVQGIARIRVAGPMDILETRVGIQCHLQYMDILFRGHQGAGPFLSQVVHKQVQIDPGQPIIIDRRKGYPERHDGMDG